jgi:hypothetical protein
MAQGVDILPSKHKALISNPVPPKIKTKQKPKMKQFMHVIKEFR